MVLAPTPRQRHYWALLSNPQHYRIVDAVRECECDSWNVARSPIRAGDRAIFWKAKGRDTHRGIIALAEVLTDPQLGLDPNRAYWVDPSAADHPVERVTVRYLVHTSLPLWEGADAPSLLSGLSVGHATGGSIFRVTEDQWAALMEVLGGWPDPGPEIEAAANALETYARGQSKQRAGQGYQVDIRLRKAIEDYAMAAAAAHYTQQGWHVDDVSATQPYDLRCTRGDTAELHIEVKGTTSEGNRVLLTRNEVIHARSQYPHVALFILAEIRWAPCEGGEYQLSGGMSIIHEPWTLNGRDLVPLAYAYAPSKR